MLIEYCKMHSIEYYISAIRDLPDQLIGSDYIKKEIV